MNPEALPSKLSELLLTETTAKTDQNGQGPSSGDADRFERYLSSARRSTTSDHARPASPSRAAGPSAASAPRSDASRPPAERSSRSERPRAQRDERTERRSIEDRPTDPTDRQDPVADREPSETAADDRRVDDGRDHRGTDDDRSPTDDSATSNKATSNDATSNDATSADGDSTGQGERTGSASKGDTEVPAVAEGADPDLATADLDLALVAETTDDRVAGSDDTDRSDDPALAAEDGGLDLEGVAAETAEAVDVADEVETAPPGLALDRATDPTIAAAVATATGVSSTGTNLAGDDAPSPDELAIDPEGSAAAEAGSVEPADPIDDGAANTDTNAETEVEAAVDRTDTDPGTDDGDAAPDAPIDAADGARSAATGGATGESASDRGPVATPAGGPTAAASNPTATTGNPAAGIEATAAPVAPRAGTTTGPSSTHAGQQAQAPLADAEAGDPLWLQVRRAMGSLRTLQSGEQQLTIRLRPAELGSVMVRVNAGENGTTVSLVADSAVAANQLSQQRQQLIGELEQSGFTEVDVDVGTEGEADLRDGADAEDNTSNGTDADGSATAAAMAGAGALSRTGGRGRRAPGTSGSLLDVDL